MIPRTYPSTIDPVSGEAQMVVKKLTSVIGLTRWVDYIPVKYNTDETAGGTYSTSVYVDPFVTGTQAWVDHIPVYEDPSATDAWMCSDTGYIPYGTAAVVAAQAVLKGPKCVLWQDASDLSTLFQDSAGTTPVTAVEQPVGLVLDKKTAGQLGSELILVNNATTTGATGWTAVDSQTVTAGKSYVITYTVSQSSGSLTLSFAGSTVATHTGAVSGSFRVQNTPSAGGKLLVYSSASVGSITSISVREIPGAHFVQATPASRPTLSSRYNLLTKTEQFDDGVWSKINSTVSTNAATAPDGTLTADKIIANATSGEHYAEQTFTGNTNGQYVQSYDVKVDAAIPFICFAAVAVGTPYTVAYWFIRNTAGVLTHEGTTTGIDSYSIEAKTNGWYRLTLRYTLSGTVTSHRMRIYSLSAAAGTTALTGDGVSGIFVHAASAVPAADAALPYQRVNTVTDYDFDFAKFPPYLRFDGVDDSRASAATVDLTGTDKITVVGAWHKASDAATAAVLEFSTNALTTNGAFVLGAPFGTGTPTLDFYVRGTAVTGASLGSTPAPSTNVISAVGNISGDLNRITKNGSTSIQNSSDLGTGNYGNHTLNVGSRAGSSLRFNGREYGFAVFNTTLTNAELATVEAYFRAKSRAY